MRFRRGCRFLAADDDEMMRGHDDSFLAARRQSASADARHAPMAAHFAMPKAGARHDEHARTILAIILCRFPFLSRRLFFSPRGAAARDAVLNRAAYAMPMMRLIF